MLTHKWQIPFLMSFVEVTIGVAEEGCAPAEMDHSIMA